MTRVISQLEIEVARFALHCEGNAEHVVLPDPNDLIAEDHPGIIRRVDAKAGSRHVGAAAAVYDGDHVVIDIFCDEDNKVSEIAYVSMLGIDPPRFPSSIDALACDQPAISESVSNSADPA